MSLITITAAISVAVVSLVAYSAIVIASKQERLAMRVRDENRFIRAPRYPYTAASRFAFETSEEIIVEGEINSNEE